MLFLTISLRNQSSKFLLSQQWLLISLQSSLPSQFENVEKNEPLELSIGGDRDIGHILSSKSPSAIAKFDEKYGTSNQIEKTASSSCSKMEMEETDEARRRFPNSKSISSRQFFTDEVKIDDLAARSILKKLSGATAISSLDLLAGSKEKPPVSEPAPKSQEQELPFIFREIVRANKFMDEIWKQWDSAFAEDMLDLEESWKVTTEQIRDRLSFMRLPYEKFISLRQYLAKKVKLDDPVVPASSGATAPRVPKPARAKSQEWEPPYIFKPFIILNKYMDEVGKQWDLAFDEDMLDLRESWKETNEQIKDQISSLKSITWD